MNEPDETDEYSVPPLSDEQIQLFEQFAMENADPAKGRRKIATARTLQEINDAVIKGLRPLIRRVERSSEIWSRLLVFQDPLTGLVKESGDLRDPPDAMDLVLDIEFYPHSYPSPYAAYLIPHDLQPGDEVWLEDLIEDVIGSSWSQGPKSRLTSCSAVWNGRDFELMYDEARDAKTFIG